MVLVGIDGLGWDVLLPLVREGRTPHLEALMREGVYGRLTTIEPTISPAIWTTIATGRSVEAHGIDDFVAPDPATGRSVRVTSNLRRVPALWNVLSAYDRTVGVIGWWVTWPAEEVDGVLVSAHASARVALDDGGAPLGGGKGQLWHDLPEQTWPPALADELRPMLDAELAGLPGHLREMFPRFDPARARGVAEAGFLRESEYALLADRTFTSAALHVLGEDRSFDLFATYLGGVDVLGHRFWRWYRPGDFAEPPSAEGVALLGPLLPDYVAYADRLVGEVLARARRDGATVLVVSDHGMHAARGAHPRLGHSGEHRDAPPGVLIAAGAAIRRASAEIPTDEASLPTLGSVYDVAPTVIHLLGVPIARDLEGSVLSGILRPEVAARSPGEVDTWLGAWQPRGGPPIASDLDEEAIRRLEALGYLEGDTTQASP